MTKVVTEHFVAVNHQRPFDIDGDNALKCIDKSVPKIMPRPIGFSGIFAQNKIYEHDDFEFNSIEKGEIGRIENAFWPIRDKILDGNVQGFGQKQITQICEYVVLQDLRTRVSFLALLESSSLLHEMLSAIGERYKNIVPETRELAQSEMKATILHGLNDVKKYSRMIENNIVKIAKAPEGRGFVASDKLVIKKNQWFKWNDDKIDYRLNGYGCVGLELFMPISDGMGIWITCRETLKKLVKSHNLASKYPFHDPLLTIQSWFNQVGRPVKTGIRKSEFDKYLSLGILKKLYVEVPDVYVSHWNYQQTYSSERWIASDREAELHRIMEILRSKPELMRRPRPYVARHFFEKILPKIVDEAAAYCVKMGVDVGENGELLEELKGEIYNRFISEKIIEIEERYSNEPDEEFKIPVPKI